MSDDSDLIFSRRIPSKPAAPRSVETKSASESTGAWWSIPLLCVGLAVIAYCVIVPATNANRKLVLEREKLHRDLEAVDKQIAVNEEFLKRVGGDPELAERLAQRQMKFIREGTNVLELPTQSSTKDQMSPFLLTAMPQAAPLAQLAETPGMLGKLASNEKLQLYAIGGGLLLLAVALVMGGSTQPAGKL